MRGGGGTGAGRSLSRTPQGPRKANWTLNILTEGGFIEIIRRQISSSMSNKPVAVAAAAVAGGGDGYTVAQHNVYDRIRPVAHKRELG